MRSLRFRLIAVAGLAILVALGAVALLSRQAARTEFRSYVVRDRAEHVRSLADALGARLASEQHAGGLDSMLADQARREGRDLLLV